LNKLKIKKEKGKDQREYQGLNNFDIDALTQTPCIHKEPEGLKE
jgi:hypothetical protein